MAHSFAMGLLVCLVTPGFLAVADDNDKCFCSNHPDGCTSCDYGCKCKPSAVVGMALNATQLGAGARLLSDTVGSLLCRCSNHPDGCTGCDNGCQCCSSSEGCAFGKGKGNMNENKNTMGSGTVDEETKPSVKPETSKAVEKPKTQIVKAKDDNDKCFCSNHPDGCTSCDYGCKCKPSAAVGMALNATQLGAGARLLSDTVGSLLCRCSNHPDGCTGCDNGCQCCSSSEGCAFRKGNKTENKNAMGSGTVDEETKPSVKPETGKAVKKPKAEIVKAKDDNDRCFCSNHPEGCTSCDYGCKCKPSAVVGMARNTTQLGAGASPHSDTVGSLLCRCSNHPEGCTSCDNGCQCCSSSEGCAFSSRIGSGSFENMVVI